MLISFIKDNAYGYVREDRVGIYSFLSNNNLALRRKAVIDAGGYNDSLRIAEDYDLCQRLGRAEWLLYFCPNVACSHRARKSVHGLLRQWWNYGVHLADGYYRYHSGRAIMTLGSPRWEEHDNPEPIRGDLAASSGPRRRLPVSVFIHVSPFVMMQVAVVAWLVLALVWGNLWMDWAMAAVCALLVIAYARVDLRHLRRDGLRRAAGLVAIRFAVNSAFVWGGVVGSLKCGALYIFPPIQVRVTAEVQKDARRAEIVETPAAELAG
jgi:hypothetical protein